MRSRSEEEAIRDNERKSGSENVARMKFGGDAADVPAKKGKEY